MKFGEGWNFGAQHVIALIDCHPDMFVRTTNNSSNNHHHFKKKDDHDDDVGNGGRQHSHIYSVGDDHHRNSITTPFDMSLELILILMQQTIEQTVIRKTGKRNGVGLILYNTRLDRRSRKNDQHHQIKDGNVVDDEDDDDDDDDDKMDDEDDDDNDNNNSNQHEGDDSGSDDGSDRQHYQASPVHELLDLVPPGIQHVQTLRHLVENKNDRDLKDEFCPDNQDEIPRIAPLQIAIEDATRKFITAKCVKDPNRAIKDKEFDHRSIWIFTNQDDPYPHDSIRHLVDNVANEAKEQKINIVVWPLRSSCTPGSDDDDITNRRENFESPFFDMIASERTFERRMNDMTNLEDGLEDIMRSMRKNRRSYFGPLHILGPNLVQGNDESCSIMIDWYPVVQLAKRPSKVNIDDETKR
jgi:hypothetical protein